MATAYVGVKRSANGSGGLENSPFRPASSIAREVVETAADAPEPWVAAVQVGGEGLLQGGGMELAFEEC
jgi:hypothetical protein